MSVFFQRCKKHCSGQEEQDDGDCADDDDGGGVVCGGGFEILTLQPFLHTYIHACIHTYIQDTYWLDIHVMFN